MPAEVYSFEPVYVLYSVENTGASPVYLPAESAPHLGPGVYVAARGETPRPNGIVHGDRAYAHAGESMSLGPGERWLFYEKITRSSLYALEGQFSVQAVMSSSGLCGEKLKYGRHSREMAPSLYLETKKVGVFEKKVYSCWRGETRSNVWTLTVKRPRDSVDGLAHEYLERTGGLKYYPDSGEWRIKQVVSIEEKHPNSHYTYALVAGATSVFAKMRAVALQPDNPLNPWVMGDVARQVLDYRSSCWSHQPREFDLSIEQLELPAGVHAYLEQYAWYLENRHCPNLVASRELHKVDP
jgi:hypothetical protein